MVVHTAQYSTGAKLPAIQDLYTRRCQRKALKLVKDPDHPIQRLFSLLPHDQLQTRYNTLTKERFQLQTSYNTLTKERDQLQTSSKTLTKERDQLQTSYNNLNEERDQLQTSSKTLTKERDQLQTSYNNLNEERDQLQTSSKTLTKERDQLQTSYNNLNEEREQDQLQMSYNGLTKERDQLQMSYNGLTKERDQLQMSYKGLTKERCSNGWMRFEGSCYYISTFYISTVKNTWDYARQDCLSRGADLVIIESKDEQAFINGLKSVSHVWIGLTDSVTEGTWKWVNGTPLTTPRF
ncbi:C-type lectin domain family 4 member F-like [Oncorhynchus masou masou]|uniref:C-type lectin domain family 4 member F-like n=1 Tax=Oncorhynchus masou masou TaxID=90313 RepID=UPI0031842F3A